MPVRSVDQFRADAGAHFEAFGAELDAAYAEFLQETRGIAPRLEARTKAGIIRDLAARRMREFCDRTKGAEFIRKGNLGVIGLANNWVLRLKKVADGFKVAVSPTGASEEYNRNEVPASLDAALLPEPPATCLYLAWAVPENAPHRIENVWPAPSARRFHEPGLISRRQRIRSQGSALAKMEIRTSRSS